MSIILTEKQHNTFLKSLYIKGSNIIEFGEYSIKTKTWRKFDYPELFENFMLICQGCGRGKTTYALSNDALGLLEQINAIKYKHYEIKRLSNVKYRFQPIKREQTVFLCSRTAQVKQFLQQHSDIAIKARASDFQLDKDEINFYETEERQGKIRITTAHQWGEWEKQGLIEVPPIVMIVDETHSLFAERKFADSLSYTVSYLEKHYKDTIKIGLTATPEFLFDYVEKWESDFRFVRIDKELPPKYQANKIKVLMCGKVESVVEQYKETFNARNKALIYRQSAEGCYKLSNAIGEDSTFFISDWYERKPEITAQMKELGYKQSVLDNEILPDGINSVVFNSSCREGITIKDKDVKIMIIDAVDMLTIEQVIGRIRKDLEEIIVICNFQYENMIDKEIKKWNEFYTSYTNAQTDLEREHILGLQYAEQKENKNIPRFVYDDKGQFRISYGAIEWLEYIKYECYAPLHNPIYRQSQVFKGDNFTLAERREAYLNRLSKYAVDRKIMIQIVQQNVIEANHANVIRRFKEIESEWINKPIGREEKKTLCDQLKTLRANGKNASWNTIKQLLIDGGYQIKQKRIGTKNYDVIFT